MTAFRGQRPGHRSTDESLAPKAPRDFFGRLGLVLEMIKFRHSIFALPFALAAMLAAADGFPSPATLLWIVVACVAARNLAMAYNRLADVDVDGDNPRTAGRALPAGRLSQGFTARFIIANVLIFLLAAWLLNPLCLLLAPLVLAVLLGYSHGKRYTRHVHLWLGLALGLAPLGAWVAVRGSLAGLPLLLAAGVAFWTAGFDIYYSSLDVAHDRRQGLHSLPARAGIRPALRIAGFLHLLCVFCLGVWIAETGLGVFSWLALAAGAVLLWLESREVHPDDLSQVGPAFFRYNAAMSMLFLLGVALDIFIQ